MPFQSTILISTTSSTVIPAPVVLDWVGTAGPTTVVISAGSTSMTGGGVLQYTLGDPTVSTAFTSTGATSTATWSSGPYWYGISSFHLSSAGQFNGSTVPVASAVISAATIADLPFQLTISTPLAALRFNCSAISSAYFMMQVLQGR